jgi:hypothetical protein
MAENENYRELVRGTLQRLSDQALALQDQTVSRNDCVDRQEVNRELDHRSARRYFWAESCAICGEAVTGDDVAEMNDPGMFDPSFTEEERLVAQEREPNHGIVHPQCGLDRGWVIS